MGTSAFLCYMSVMSFLCSVVCLWIGLTSETVNVAMKKLTGEIEAENAKNELATQKDEPVDEFVFKNVSIKLVRNGTRVPALSEADFINLLKDQSCIGNLEVVTTIGEDDFDTEQLTEHLQMVVINLKCQLGDPTTAQSPWATSMDEVHERAKKFYPVVFVWLMGVNIFYLIKILNIPTTLKEICERRMLSPEPAVDYWRSLEEVMEEEQQVRILRRNMNRERNPRANAPTASAG